MNAAALSPAMLSALTEIIAGQEVDGRSWRALQGLERRGLIELAGDEWIPTDAGRAALRPSTFRLEIRLGNAEMLEADHVAEALAGVARRLADRDEFTPGNGAAILDLNGNRVGDWSFE